MVSNSCFPCGVDPQSLMPAAKVVVHEVKRDGITQVINFLCECVRESGKTAHLLERRRRDTGRGQRKSSRVADGDAWKARRSQRGRGRSGGRAVRERGRMRKRGLRGGGTLRRKSPQQGQRPSSAMGPVASARSQWPRASHNGLMHCTVKPGRYCMRTLSVASQLCASHDTARAAEPPSGGGLNRTVDVDSAVSGLWCQEE
jgi:hypothetical protein